MNAGGKVGGTEKSVLLLIIEYGWFISLTSTGSTGCYVVTLTGSEAIELVKDPQVTLAVPLEASFKSDPALMETIDTATTNAFKALSDSDEAEVNEIMSFHVTLADADDVERVRFTSHDSWSQHAKNSEEAYLMLYICLYPVVSLDLVILATVFGPFWIE